MAKKAKKAANSLKFLAAVAIGHDSVSGKVYVGVSDHSKEDAREALFEGGDEAASIIILDKVLVVKGKTEVAVDKGSSVPEQVVTV